MVNFQHTHFITSNIVDNDLVRKFIYALHCFSFNFTVSLQMINFWNRRIANANALPLQRMNFNCKRIRIYTIHDWKQLLCVELNDVVHKELLK